MLKIGLTGGIGSGKSTVARIFEVLGISVYYADDAAKKLMNENEELKESITKSFGRDAYINGSLNRKYLAEQVFNNDEKIGILNSLVHPFTIKDAAEWMQMQKAPYIIKEAALIFESGSNKNLDFVIGVRSPLTLRLHRAMDRDNISADEVKARMDKQMDEELKLRLCDYVIVNYEQEMLIPQVLSLHEKFLRLDIIS
ncbi:MAG: dephospho-CoA kinase [Ginsengibacter sp.]